jgi:hypothetical protein
MTESPDVDPDPSAAVTIDPDTKDWTWVLERPCPECGFDASSVAPTAVAALLRANAADWLSILAADPDLLRRRTRPTRWAPVEYACHVRDVCRLYESRLGLMLTQNDPLYPNWDQDATALAERYDRQDPSAVAPQLASAAAALAARFDAVSGLAWQRTGRRSDGATFTVASFGRYFIHDPIHHLHDVQEDLTDTLR